MPRIRSIKPEFWSSPGIEELDPRWRLLFIAMWQWADDYGRGTAEPRELMGFAFPRDENMTLGEFRRGLGGIHRVFGVIFYQVEKRPYYLIPSWEKHQKIDKRAKASKYPSPKGDDLINPENGQVIGVSPEFSGGPIEDSEEPAELSRKVGAGTGEQGNRGTGGKDSLNHCDEPPFRLEAAAVDHPDGRSSESTYPHTFEEWWALYPRKAGKGDALKAWRKAIKAKGEHPLLEATRERMPALRQKETRFQPHPATWLNQARYDDPVQTEPEQRPSNGFLALLNDRRAGEQHERRELA